MARPSKSEVSAINIRIPSDRERNYSALLDHLFNLKVGVRVHGEKYVAISYFDPKSNVGIFSKYSEIDVDGDWFDIEDFDIATPEAVSEVVIPEHLRPNHTAFYFWLNPELHVVAFETYSASKTLSSKSVEKYFREILGRQDVQEIFGYVESDIVKSYEAVEEILNLKLLKELSITIRRPNQDDISGGDARDIEKRLVEQRSEEYSEGLKSKDKDGIVPNDRTRRLAQIAAENGQVYGKNIENGVTIEHNTEEKPLKEADTYNKEEIGTRAMFFRLAGKILEKIRAHRAELLRE